MRDRSPNDRTTRSGFVFGSWTRAFVLPKFSLVRRIFQAQEEHQNIPMDFVDSPSFEPDDSDDVRNRRWKRPEVPPAPEEPPPKRVKFKHAQRRRKRQAARTTALESSDPLQQRMRLAENVSTVHTDFNTDELVQSTSGYVGSERVDEDLKALRLVHSLDDLVGPDSEWNFTVVPANLEQPTITLFTDANERVFVTRVPPPAGDDSFPKAAEDAAAILENYRPLFFNPAKPFRQHRRGDFPVIAVGLSFGGGQQEPKRIYQNDKDLQLLNNICGMACFKRLACHASSAFQTWAPKLYQLYAGYMDRLQKLFPDRYLNFSRSVFACCTLNFGPRTTTIEHLDHLNYIYGWCAITALGSFDFRSGGHLVLWDLEMVIEVPPGWTMLIPSSYLRHSNTAIAPEETRYSLTQYTAGGLFRVIDDEGHVRKHMSQAEKSAAEELQRERINMDLNCYSTLMELGITPAE